GRGSIVNTSSRWGLVGGAQYFDYCASKFAVTGMTKAAAVELGDYGIRVNSVHPGATLTPIVKKSGTKDEDLQGFVDAFPIKRWADPREIAEAYLFLASDAASFCTGAAFAVDGGATAQ
ncbi:SDR family NAD(P)-dependent oxidoreductase, partial [Sphingobium sp.]|uniref:SDR family NAD(P)-dependent oxidoreductase n=1 Tax=Sphingobium sp. TaxID=1912891 RepID=UPI002C6019AA